MKKSIRHLAVDILDQVDRTKAFASQILDEYLEANELSSSTDGRLLTHLVYGVLRFRGHLDWILVKLYRGQWEKMNLRVKNILRVGLFQLKFSDRLPSFAVVDEAVKIAKKTNPSASGLVNAVLRNYLRQCESIAFPLTQEKAAFIAAFYSHPLWLVKYWIKTFGPEETQALCTANNELPPLTLRVNTQKTSRDELLEKLSAAGFHVSVTSFSPDGLILHNAPEPIHKTRFFREGYLRLQDEASQLVSWLVNPQDAQSILDICSGTGGKTTHLAAILKNNGRILAVDYDRVKIEQLKAETARLGATNIETHHADLTVKLIEPSNDRFDQVLVDAPCSGSGTLRRNPEIKWRITASDLDKIVQVQKTILQNAAAAVRKGGRLIYCTCSLLPEENENVIADFLQSNSDFTLCTTHPAISTQLIDPTGYFRTYPHLHNMDGFFGAVLLHK
jgi:16S rRNA (cytosine967-C5)-methyltransferase